MRVCAALALSGWVIFVTDVDYYEMSSKISPIFRTNFSLSSSTASGITLKMLRGLINKFSQIFVCNARVTLQPGFWTQN